MERQIYYILSTSIINLHFLYLNEVFQLALTYCNNKLFLEADTFMASISIQDDIYCIENFSDLLQVCVIVRVYD